MVYKWVGYEAFGGVGKSTAEGPGMVVKTNSSPATGLSRDGHSDGWRPVRTPNRGQRERDYPRRVPILWLRIENFETATRRPHRCRTVRRDITYSLVLRKDRSG